MGESAEQVWSCFEALFLQGLNNRAATANVARMVTDEVNRALLQRLRSDFIRNWQPGPTYPERFYWDRVDPDFQAEVRALTGIGSVG